MANSVLKEFAVNGGRLLSDCKVTQLVMKGSNVLYAKAHTVDIEKPRLNMRIIANFFFVCGGATQTPNLLLRSGFKRPVGLGFKVHPTIRVLADFDRPINAQSSRHPLFAITEFAPDIRLGGSVFTLPTFGMFLAEDWSNRQDMAGSYANFGMYYAMARGSGSGSVSNIPFSTESLVRYRLSELDMRSLVYGLEMLCTALFEIGAVRIQPVISGCRAWASVDEMQAYLKCGLSSRDCNIMTIHLFCSLPMGEDKSTSAADSFGKLHDTENLYVADASLIPDSPGVNPQATVMALSLRVAESFIRENRG